MLDCSGCEERSMALWAMFRPKRMVTRHDVVREARTWLHTPFKHQGYAKGVGADCIGFVCGVALALGIQGAQEWKDDPACHSYGRPPNPRFLLETCERFLDRVEVPELADILVMSFEREPMHFALVASLDPLYVIHSLYGAGRVVEHRIDGRWQGRVRMAFSFRGLA